jgi:2'-5' RNA ligase
MIIGYALMLNNECHNFIREIQLELHQVIGIGLPRQTPHITIKSPFEINDIKNHVEYIEDLSLRTFGPYCLRTAYLMDLELQSPNNLPRWLS